MRPAIQIINNVAVTTQAGDVYGGFALHRPDAKGLAPAEFAQLSYVARRLQENSGTRNSASLGPAGMRLPLP